MALLDFFGNVIEKMRQFQQPLRKTKSQTSDKYFIYPLLKTEKNTVPFKA